jgi:hypothetical protein
MFEIKYSLRVMPVCYRGQPAHSRIPFGAKTNIFFTREVTGAQKIPICSYKFSSRIKN